MFSIADSCSSLEFQIEYLDNNDVKREQSLFTVDPEANSRNEGSLLKSKCQSYDNKGSFFSVTFFSLRS